MALLAVAIIGVAGASVRPYQSVSVSQGASCEVSCPYRRAMLIRSLGVAVVAGIVYPQYLSLQVADLALSLSSRGDAGLIMVPYSMPAALLRLSLVEMVSTVRFRCHIVSLGLSCQPRGDAVLIMVPYSLLAVRSPLSRAEKVLASSVRCCY